MALLNQSVQVYGQIPKFLETLRAGTAPSSFTRQFLKDINFKSSNHHQFIPLLKGLGFLTPDGTPTERYKQFLDGSRWKKVLAEAVRDACGDIFVIKARPTSSDVQMIAGKFKSTYNLSDLQAERAARTFLALLNLADQEALYGSGKSGQTSEGQAEQPGTSPASEPSVSLRTIDGSPVAQPVTVAPMGLHYNIQIHLPATKDIEVYNAIFKSLREHLID